MAKRVEFELGMAKGGEAMAASFGGPSAKAEIVSAEEDRERLARAVQAFDAWNNSATGRAARAAAAQAVNQIQTTVPPVNVKSIKTGLDLFNDILGQVQKRIYDTIATNEATGRTHLVPWWHGDAEWKKTYDAYWDSDAVRFQRWHDLRHMEWANRMAYFAHNAARLLAEVTPAKYSSTAEALAHGMALDPGMVFGDAALLNALRHPLTDDHAYQDWKAKYGDLLVDIPTTMALSLADPWMWMVSQAPTAAVRVMESQAWKGIRQGATRGQVFDFLKDHFRGGEIRPELLDQTHQLVKAGRFNDAQAWVRAHNLRPANPADAVLENTDLRFATRWARRPGYLTSSEGQAAFMQRAENQALAKWAAREGYDSYQALQAHIEGLSSRDFHIFTTLVDSELSIADIAQKLHEGTLPPITAPALEAYVEYQKTTLKDAVLRDYLWPKQLARRQQIAAQELQTSLPDVKKLVWKGETQEKVIFTNPQTGRETSFLFPKGEEKIIDSSTGKEFTLDPKVKDKVLRLLRPFAPVKKNYVPQLWVDQLKDSGTTFDFDHYMRSFERAKTGASERLSSLAQIYGDQKARTFFLEKMKGISQRAASLHAEAAPIQVISDVQDMYDGLKAMDAKDFGGSQAQARQLQNIKDVLNHLQEAQARGEFLKNAKLDRRTDVGFNWASYDSLIRMLKAAALFPTGAWYAFTGLELPTWALLDNPRILTHVPFNIGVNGAPLDFSVKTHLMDVPAPALLRGEPVNIVPRVVQEKLLTPYEDTFLNSWRQRIGSFHYAEKIAELERLGHDLKLPATADQKHRAAYSFALDQLQKFAGFTLPSAPGVRVAERVRPFWGWTTMNLRRAAQLAYERPRTSFALMRLRKNLNGHSVDGPGLHRFGNVGIDAQGLASLEAAYRTFERTASFQGDAHTPDSLPDAASQGVRNALASMAWLHSLSGAAYGSPIPGQFTKVFGAALKGIPAPDAEGPVPQAARQTVEAMAGIPGVRALDTWSTALTGKRLSDAFLTSLGYDDPKDGYSYQKNLYRNGIKLMEDRAPDDKELKERVEKEVQLNAAGQFLGIRLVPMGDAVEREAIPALKLNAARYEATLNSGQRAELDQALTLKDGAQQGAHLLDGIVRKSRDPDLQKSLDELSAAQTPEETMRVWQKASDSQKQGLLEMGAQKIIKGWHWLKDQLLDTDMRQPADGKTSFNFRNPFENDAEAADFDPGPRLKKLQQDAQAAASSPLTSVPLVKAPAPTDANRLLAVPEALPGRRQDEGGWNFYDRKDLLPDGQTADLFRAQGGGVAPWKARRDSNRSLNILWNDYMTRLGPGGNLRTQAEARAVLDDPRFALFRESVMTKDGFSVPRDVAMLRSQLQRPDITGKNPLYKLQFPNDQLAQFLVDPQYQLPWITKAETAAKISQQQSLIKGINVMQDAVRNLNIPAYRTDEMHPRFNPIGATATIDRMIEAKELPADFYKQVASTRPQLLRDFAYAGRTTSLEAFKGYALAGRDARGHEVFSPHAIGELWNAGYSTQLNILAARDPNFGAAYTLVTGLEPDEEQAASDALRGFSAAHGLDLDDPKVAGDLAPVLHAARQLMPGLGAGEPTPPPVPLPLPDAKAPAKGGIEPRPQVQEAGGLPAWRLDPGRVERLSVQRPARPFHSVTELAYATVAETNRLAQEREHLYPVTGKVEKTNFFSVAGQLAPYLPPERYTEGAQAIMGLGYRIGLIDRDDYAAIRQGVAQQEFIGAGLQGVQTLFSVGATAFGMRQTTESAVRFGNEHPMMARAAGFVDQHGAAISSAGSLLSFGSGIAASQGEEDTAKGLGTAGGALQGAAAGVPFAAATGGLSIAIGAAIGAAAGYFGTGGGPDNRERDNTLRDQYYQAQLQAAAQRRAAYETQGIAQRARLLSGISYQGVGQAARYGQALAAFYRRPQFASALGLVSDAERRATRQMTPRW